MKKEDLIWEEINELKRRVEVLENIKNTIHIQYPQIHQYQYPSGMYQCMWCKQFYHQNTLHSCNGTGMQPYCICGI